MAKPGGSAILCCGEALIDMLPRRTAAGAAAFQPAVGGAVLNTAVALARLGAPSGLYAGISTDLFGVRLAAGLTESGVDISLSPRSARPTTLAFVELTGGQARYAFYDENTAGRMLDPDALPSLDGEVRALFFGGISLVVEPCGAAYEALMMREAGTRLTMIDPNVRPGFVTDETAYRARLGRMMGRADVVKVSDEDLRWLSGGDGDGDGGDLEAMARALLGRGAGAADGAGPVLVCVTLGREGALAVSRTATVRRPARVVEVVDTVGAGDTFNAGLLAALHEAGRLDRAGAGDLSEDEIARALDLAAAAAAITVSREGADPPRRAELAV